ncbi:MAG: GlcNAc-PI de-N-acetylase [Acidobacteria bacterium]|nr:MAG: GlcNAc-PI de-N-acetylase [Acidobacteriota bacterium]
MNILAIGAHPDDVEFGCGGTLIKYAAKGARIDLLVMTDGARGGRARTRRREQIEAARVLGARRVHWGGYRDTLLPSVRRLIDRMERVMHTLDPDFIFVNFPEDTHQDHREVARAAISATRYTRNVLFYEGPTTVNFTPTVFIDIGGEIERKIESLRRHRSQVSRTRIESTPICEIAQASAHFRGVQGRVRWAEGFAPLRLFINITDGGIGPGRAGTTRKGERR